MLKEIIAKIMSCSSGKKASSDISSKRSQRIKKVDSKFFSNAKINKKDIKKCSSS